MIVTAFIISALLNVYSRGYRMNARGRALQSIVFRMLYILHVGATLFIGCLS